MQLKVKKHYFPHAVHYCCSSMLRLSETHRFCSEKWGVLWLASYRAFWLVEYLKRVPEMLHPLPYLETHSISATWWQRQQYYSENKSYNFFLCVNNGWCYANLPTQWCRRGGVFKWSVLGRRGRVIIFIKNISLVFRLQSLQLYWSYTVQYMYEQLVTLQRQRET